MLPAERLRYRAPGYLLMVADGELDATEFACLVAQARERVAVADHAQAVEQLDAGLRLWRGDPLAEFDAACVDPDGELVRLAELRLVAAEDRADALLHLGRGRDVVAELEALERKCSPHPPKTIASA